jgi:hypothetical protein
MFPDVALSTTNGIVVWQDNATDGDGWGISALRLDATYSGAFSSFRVNATGAGNQEHPRVALLKQGGAVIVWQGGTTGFQHIYARYLSATNTFLSTNDLLVNTFTNYFQIAPSVAVLTNGNVVVVWSSYGQVSSSSMQDVYCQILSTNGAKIGTNILINQFTSFNQRTPTVAALKNGGFVVAWVSEQERVAVGQLGTNTTYATATTSPNPSVDVYARLFNINGAAVTPEFIVSTNGNVAADPQVAAGSDGGFMLTWGEYNRLVTTNGWDVYARPFTSAGTGGAATVVNTHVIGDQYAPQIAAIGLDYFITWTSLGQDGSREGVFGQFLHNNGGKVGGEFLVNTTTAGQQMQPTVASDGVSQFLVVWTSFVGSPWGFDLYAQRYENVSSILAPMSAPYAWTPFVISNGMYQPQILVTWAPVKGLSVANYLVFVDGSGGAAATVTTNKWLMTAANGLSTNSTHSFAVEYVTSDGRTSPASPAASATTWSGYNYYGIPLEWMEQYYGMNIGSWPAANAPLTTGGLTLYQVFLSGGDPLDSTTWLKQQLVKTYEGLFLTWTTQPGATYQVQTTTNFSVWSNLGSPRFAAGTTDSIDVGGATASYYRIVLLR